tara:strand:+ start:369 stop:647 length:279 start_codon:yes stop_codon:yes gene_type:complete
MKSTGRHIRDCSANELVELSHNSIVYADAGKFMYEFKREFQDYTPMFCVTKYRKLNYEKKRVEDVKWFTDVAKYHYYIFRLASMYQRVFLDK